MKGMKFHFTETELYLAVAFAVIGFLFSHGAVVKWMSGLNPIAGLLVYYIILYASLFVLSRMGLVIFGIKIDKPLQIFGLGLITFAFFILVNWESAYVNIVTYGSATNVSNLYFASEDGAMWYLFYDVFGIKNIEASRLLTYVLMPAVLAFLGAFLLEEKEGRFKIWGKNL